ncbi:MAG: hypothetical protein QXG98_03275 [Candidatus Micrarchaeia archaeon]
MATCMADISYEELRRIQAREKSEPGLCELEADFYDRVNAHLRARRSELEKKFDFAAMREYENTLKILRDIYARREQKILLLALRAARGEEEVNGLTKEERALFDSIVKMLRECSARIQKILEVDTAAREFRKCRVRILRDVPQFVGKDMTNYGPFKLGDDVLLPEDEAARLERLGMAHIE